MTQREFNPDNDYFNTSYLFNLKNTAEEKTIVLMAHSYEQAVFWIKKYAIESHMGWEYLGEVDIYDTRPEKK